jgi:hypothetical protein
VGEGAARPAVFLGHRGAEQARLAGLGPDLARVDVVLVPLVEVRCEFGLHEAGGLVLEQDQVLGHPGRARQVEAGHE